MRWSNYFFKTFKSFDNDFDVDRWHRGRWAFGGPPFLIKRRGLRYLILNILASQGALTGSQIADEIEKMTWGFWRPSPGSIYPALAQLEAEGLIRVARVEGTKKYYELTDNGRRLLGLSSDYVREALLTFENLYNFIAENWEKLSEEDRKTLRRIAEDILEKDGHR